MQSKLEKGLRLPRLAVQLAEPPRRRQLALKHAGRRRVDRRSFNRQPGVLSEEWTIQKTCFWHALRAAKLQCCRWSAPDTGAELQNK